MSSCDINNISVVSLRRNLHRLGFNHSQFKQSINLTSEHKKKRVYLAEKWIKENRSWETTVFTDEKKFNMDGPDNWSTRTHPNNSVTRNKRQMGGGSLMVWGIIMPNGYCHVERDWTAESTPKNTLK